MHIALLAPPFQPVPPPRAGGTERVIAYLAEEFVARGHRVTLFAPSDSGGAGELVSAGRSVLSQADAPPSLPGAMEAVSLAQLRRRRHEFDAIHCHTEFLHHAVLEDVRERVVTTLHWRVDEADRQLAYGFFEDAHVIAISADQASRLAGGQVTVIHHGLPRDLYRPTQTASQRLAFVGRMTDQKRPDVAIRVARETGRELVLAGDRDVGNPTYFAREVEPHLGPAARWLGPIDDAGKQALLGDSAALLFPIDWDEPFGLVMIEAMACGCPVIAWERGSVREVIEPGVSGFIVRSEAEAIEAVGRLGELDRAEVRRAFEERFTAARLAEDHLRLFETLAARAASSPPIARPAES